MKIPTRRCDQCNGSGVVPDDAAIGAQLRKRRVARGVTLTDVAAHMNYAKGHLSDLERGRRGWSEGKIAAYEDALSAIDSGRRG